MQCLPEGRKWPGEKCERCLRHKPELECSEPKENTRKRGPNKSSSKPTKRSNTGGTPERQEAPASADDDSGTEDVTPSTPAWYRPGRYTIPNHVKKESPTPESFLSPKDDERPASAYMHLASNEFRLLRVDLNHKDKKIDCSFVKVSMIQARQKQYEAISYFWGGHNQKSTEITLRDKSGRGHRMFIATNLYNALRSICHPTEPQLYWVDALCINHSDKKERGQQVEMKRFIFHRAQNMCFWLGQDEISKTGLSFVTKEMLDLTKIDKLARDENAIDKWAAFVGLLKNTVFSRLWLVQEVVVAPNVTLHCGPTIAQYGDLVEAVAVFVSMRDSISELFRRCHRSCRVLTDRKMLMAEQFIEISTNAWRVPKKGGKIQRLLTLEELVSQLSDLTSTDPRDRIFSVLAIAKNGLELDDHTLEASVQKKGALKIDYEKPLPRVYRDFVAHAIDYSKSLDIICRRWVSSVSDDLPSWVRPLQSSQPTFDTKLEERTRADNLVGHPDHSSYSASASEPANFIIGDVGTGTENYLTVHGFRIDTITTLGVPALEGNIPNQWLEFGDCLSRKGSGHENFWRILVADRGPNGAHAPSWYRLAFLYCLEHLNSDGNINTEQLIALCEPDGVKEDDHMRRGDSSLIVDFLRRVQSVIWNRRLLVFKDNESNVQLPDVGLVPMATEIGDELCILYGCSVPVVLRRQMSEEGRPFYQLIGECYVNKMMDGEAIDMLKEGKFEVMEFEIR